LHGTIPLNSSIHLHTVILAAGPSIRFGSPKQLVRFQGRTLLQHVLGAADEISAGSMSVVLGAHAADIVAALPTGRASVLINRNWQEGLAGSLRLAVRSLPGSCNALLVLFADQPMVTAVGLERLVSACRRQPRQIIASRYDKATGVPAIFPRWCFEALCDLRGDQSVQALITRHLDHVVGLPLPEAAVDINVPEDLLELSS
jgi:molybdenum cofactor cytidylyltransferase